MLDASGTTVWCYDRRGNVIEKRLTQGSHTLNLGYAHTKGDRLAGITYPNGTTILYTRNTLGQITGVTQGSTERAQPIVPIITSAAYRPFGPIAQIAFAGGTSQGFVHDGNDWTTAITGTALDLSFEHDARGNIDSITEAVQVRRYDYDALSRLTESDYPPEEGPPIYVPMGMPLPLEHYTYDATGNRLSKEQNLPQATPYFQFYGYPADSHRLASIGSQSRTYDAMGNFTAEDNRTFAYGDDQRLKQFQVNGQTKAIYTHNGRGERTIKQADDQTWSFIYDQQGRLLAEYRAGLQSLPQLHRLYVWLDERPVAVQPKEGAYANVWLHIHTDHLGTPRAITLPKQGNPTIWRWSLTDSAFGEHASDEDPDGDSDPFTFNLRYPGQYFDQESGLHYNYFRDYEPGTGRYVQSDPIGLKDGPSVYVYVRSNPALLFDSFGLAARYNGFNKDDEKRMRKANEDAQKVLKKCTACHNCGVAGERREYCIDEYTKYQVVAALDSAEYRYVPGGVGNYCAEHKGSNLINIYPNALGQDCCALSSTLAHEAGHASGLTHRQIMYYERECFGCDGFSNPTD